MFNRLADMAVPWKSVDIFQADERVTQDPGRRNSVLIENELLDRIAGTKPQWHPMRVIGDLEEAARLYEDELISVCGDPPVLDIVHLGLGGDGHTASLIPDDPVLHVSDRWVGVSQTYEGSRRTTLSYPTIEAARTVFFEVAGADKAEALARLVARDPTMPAGRLKTELIVFADTEAAARIS